MQADRRRAIDDWRIVDARPRGKGHIRMRFTPTDGASDINMILTVDETSSRFYNFCKIWLLPGGNSATTSATFYDCSGGNSRPSHPSDVGGGIFLHLLLILILILMLEKR